MKQSNERTLISCKLQSEKNFKPPVDKYNHRLYKFHNKKTFYSGDKHAEEINPERMLHIFEKSKG